MLIPHKIIGLDIEQLASDLKRHDDSFVGIWRICRYKKGVQCQISKCFFMQNADNIA
jgi:hypothetical protein